MTPQNAAYLTADHPEEMEESIRNAAGDRDIELIVVTDVQAILGIGDWGTNGVSISTGKLMVYTAAAGIDPTKVLPVVIDADTDCQSLLDDPLYLGLHHHRIGGVRFADGGGWVELDWPANFRLRRSTGLSPIVEDRLGFVDRLFSVFGDGFGVRRWWRLGILFRGVQLLSSATCGFVADDGSCVGGVASSISENWVSVGWVSD